MVYYSKYEQYSVSKQANAGSVHSPKSPMGQGKRSQAHVGFGYATLDEQIRARGFRDLKLEKRIRATDCRDLKHMSGLKRKFGPQA